MMLAGVAEKFFFAASTFVLLTGSRVPLSVGVFAGIDLLLGVLFLVAYYRCALPMVEQDSTPGRG
ncbi:hypothetical protein [Bythopirellula polymerisocia]|uniref:Uncharacterized protein n=1 Tax=Bythopirellula polymerisocia TaxID=2528003 RepID=A0A5C6CFF1_9BACT|nr:hypothetical protein [Bythopirellula polymerisocia]TWU23633.1 hypothetical protein Pla144_38080 [Bythopirellula polymerisocia]